MNKSVKNSILIVDDNESIRFAISDYLRSDFEVSEAGNGVDALEIIENNPIELIITDIRMPEMGGLELIAEIQKRFPHIKYALMTAYNTNDYIAYIRQHRIWNIIPKTTMLDLKFIKIMAQKLLGNDIFGIHKYFPECKKLEISMDELNLLAAKKIEFKNDIYYTLRFNPELKPEHLCELIGEVMVRAGTPASYYQIIEELLSNAMLHSAQKATNSHTDQEPLYSISFGMLSEMAVFTVSDPFGTLDCEEILGSLERQITQGQNGLPIGINDVHGRGLFISREYLDHLIFNIEEGVQTEIIGILSPRKHQKYRAISIYCKD